MDIKDSLVNIKEQTDEMSGAIKELRDLILANPLCYIIDEKEEDKHVKSIKFEKRKREITLDIKEAKFLNIDDIRMTNEGIHSYKNLCFVKDKEKSSEEINFFGHNKHTDIFQLTMAGEFEPNSNANFNITVAINNPKPEQIYKMVIYVREKNSKKELKKYMKI